jgi:hypothetical protein
MDGTSGVDPIAGPLGASSPEAGGGGGTARVLDADERAELERLRKANTELRLDREFLKKAADHNLVCPAGSTGVCWDNVAESFWATLKVKLYGRYLLPTKAAAKRAVGDWIERVYNRRRRHSAIGMTSPVE